MYLLFFHLMSFLFKKICTPFNHVLFMDFYSSKIGCSTSSKCSVIILFVLMIVKKNSGLSMASDILSYWKFPNVQCSSLFPHTQLPQYCKVIMTPGPVALSFINELYFSEIQLLIVSWIKQTEQFPSCRSSQLT